MSVWGVLERLQQYRYKHHRKLERDILPAELMINCFHMWKMLFWDLKSNHTTLFKWTSHYLSVLNNRNTNVFTNKYSFLSKCTPAMQCYGITTYDACKVAGMLSFLLYIQSDVYINQSSHLINASLPSLPQNWHLAQPWTRCWLSFSYH